MSDMIETIAGARGFVWLRQETDIVFVSIEIGYRMTRPPGWDNYPSFFYNGDFFPRRGWAVV